MLKSQVTPSRSGRWPTPVALALLFAVLVWWPIEKAWQHFCPNNFDLGIYAQAVSSLSWTDWNPWISGRELRIFNDHFDPVLFLLAPFAKPFAPGLFLIRFEMMMAIATMVPFFWLATKGKISKRVAALLATAFLFNRASLSAFYYPAHPGTWAILPLAWTCALLIAERYFAAILAFAFCLACKEEYPAVGIAIALGLALTRKNMPAAAFAALSAMWGLLVFVGRPALIGPATIYTSEFSAGAGVVKILAWLEVQNLVKWLLYMVLPFAVLAWCARPLNGLVNRMLNRRRNRRARRQGMEEQPALPAIVFILCALLATRTVGGWWYSHRSAPVVIALAFVVAQLIPPQRQLSLRGILVVACVIFAGAQPALRQGFRILGGKDFASHCPANPRRLAELNHALSILRTEIAANPGRLALVQGNLLPHLADLNQVAHLGATRAPTESFTWLLAERSPAGNPWPANTDQLDAIIAAWRNTPGIQVLLDNEAILLKSTHTPVP